MAIGSELSRRLKKAVAVLFGREEEPKAEPAATAGEPAPSPSNPSPTLSAKPGIQCPRCAFHIEISIPVLLSGMPIQCPNCALKLTVNQEKSADSLAALRKLQGDFDIATDQMQAATGRR